MTDEVRDTRPRKQREVRDCRASREAGDGTRTIASTSLDPDETPDAACSRAACCSALGHGSIHRDLASTRPCRIRGRASAAPSAPINALLGGAGARLGGRRVRVHPETVARAGAKVDAGRVLDSPIRTKSGRPTMARTALPPGTPEEQPHALEIGSKRCRIRLTEQRSASAPDYSTWRRTSSCSRPSVPAASPREPALPAHRARRPDRGLAREDFPAFAKIGGARPQTPDGGDARRERQVGLSAVADAALLRGIHEAETIRFWDGLGQDKHRIRIGVDDVRNETSKPVDAYDIATLPPGSGRAGLFKPLPPHRNNACPFARGSRGLRVLRVGAMFTTAPLTPRYWRRAPLTRRDRGGRVGLAGGIPVHLEALKSRFP